MGSAISSFGASPAVERRVPRALLATIGHELRTPLTSIRGYLDTLLEGEFDPRTARRFLETARRETLRLGRLVEGMLDLSSVDITARDERASCDVVEQIDATVEMLSPMAVARHVTIRRRLPETAWACVDGDACVHAIANLVENALKHGSEFGIVEISCTHDEQNVWVAVEDDGGGIPADVRELIFIMGVRGHTARRAGSGIGLAVVKAIAEHAGGDVWTETSALGGARFVLRFRAG